MCSIGNQQSQLEEIEEGVPQGGHLATTLYLIYTENFFQILLDGKVFLYADDTTIIYSGYDINKLQQNINSDLKKNKSTYNKHIKNQIHDYTQQQKY